MKFLVAIVLTGLLAFVGGLWLDWWVIAIAGFIVAVLVHQRAGKAFFAGFIGVFLLWALFAAWIDMKNESVLSAKIATVLPLGGNSILLILITGFAGGLVAAFGALSGSYLRSSR